MPARRGVHQPPRPGAGRPKAIEVLRLSVADAELLRGALGEDLEDALRRIAASAAADREGTQAALAPLLAVEAWNEKIL